MWVVELFRAVISLDADDGAVSGGIDGAGGVLGEDGVGVGFGVRTHWVGGVGVADAVVGGFVAVVREEYSQSEDRCIRSKETNLLAL